MAGEGEAVKNQDVPDWVWPLRKLGGNAYNHHCIARQNHLIVSAFQGVAASAREFNKAFNDLSPDLKKALVNR